MLKLEIMKRVVEIIKTCSDHIVTYSDENNYKGRHFYTVDGRNSWENLLIKFNSNDEGCVIEYTSNVRIKKLKMSPAEGILIKSLIGK